MSRISNSREESYFLPDLKMICNKDMFHFETTQELEPVTDGIGQERGIKALQFGVQVSIKGYNIYIEGPSGVGKTMYTKNYLDSIAPKKKVPNDWCYIYNFQNPNEPIAVSLPAGQGKEFKESMDGFIKEVKKDIKKTFNADDFEKEKTLIKKEFEEKREIVMSKLSKDALEEGFQVKSAQNGIYMMPVIDGKVIPEEEFDKLEESVKQKYEEKSLIVQQQIMDAIGQIKEIERQADKKVSEWQSNVALLTVNAHINYIKSKYKSDLEYKKDLRKIYIIKIKAFEYAKKRILQEFNNKNKVSQTTLYEYLRTEIEQNGYHEKSELREKLNQYMAEFIENNYDSEIQEKYEMFYWITLDDIEAEFGTKQSKPDDTIKDYETFMEDEKEYAELIHKGALQIHEKPEFEEEKYYTANTKNSVELDTYLTNPHNRSIGIARIIVFEGIKKHIERHFKNPENQEIFLCSTLHRDNLSSKYVSEFFGLTDSLYVNRRQGRDREVHICKITREEAMEYLTNIYNKLAVLYNYNPEGKVIKDSIALKILQEQLKYEEKEKKRLVRAKTIDKKLKGINHKFIPEKERKIKRLKQQISQIQDKNELQQ